MTWHVVPCMRKLWPPTRTWSTAFGGTGLGPPLPTTWSLPCHASRTTIADVFVMLWGRLAGSTGLSGRRSLHGVSFLSVLSGLHHSPPLLYHLLLLAPDLALVIGVWNASFGLAHFRRRSEKQEEQEEQEEEKKKKKGVEEENVDSTYMKTTTLSARPRKKDW